jgi:class 3 adenylate cyclase
MVRQIISAGGYVDKFIGDAIMAVFRGENHLQNAIKASLAVRKEISNLPVVEADFMFTPRVSVGINSGEMVSGNIGSKSLKRFDYTVIGDTVNTAARLQSAAGENRILITQECYYLVKDHFDCRLIGPIKLKNKSEPIIAYEVE